MMQKNFRSALIKTIVLAAFASLFVLPLVWMIFASLKNSNEIFSQSWLPTVWKWDNYKTVWTNPQVSMFRSYFNSIAIVVLGSLGQVIIASLAAFAFAKLRFRGKNIIFTLFLAALMIPSQVTIIPRFMLFFKLGLYNKLWSLILPAWFGPTAIFLLRQFYMSLPDELMEAAKIDGAGPLRIFWQILMPLTKPAMISVFILSFISLWNEYLSALVFLSDKKMYTVSQAIRFYLFDTAQRYELTMAAATSAILPVMILFIVCQKYFVEGIATSGVKG